MSDAFPMPVEPEDMPPADDNVGRDGVTPIIQEGQVVEIPETYIDADGKSQPLTKP